MAVTIDSRPTVFGDRMIVTGSYEAGDTSISLTGLLDSIDAVICNPSNPAIQAVDPDDDGSDADLVNLSLYDFASFSGSTITISPASEGGTTGPGTFLAIGRRA